jgi:hypothetical protein
MTVLTRDQHGGGHAIEVLAQHGLVVLRDDAVIRLLAQRAAIELAAELIAATVPAAPPESVSASL